MKKLGLFANCKLVKGATRSVICDLQRQEIYFISDPLYSILSQHIHKTKPEILSEFNPEHHPYIEDYLTYLEEEELVFWDEDVALFPGISEQFDYPGWIHNAIIEWSPRVPWQLAAVISQLTALGCQYIEFRIYQQVSLDDLLKVVRLFENSIIRNIDLYVKYSPALFLDDALLSLPLQFQRIGSIILHSAPKDEQLENRILQTSLTLQDNSHCGQISPRYFTPNLAFYNESLHHNNCLNRKVSISEDGTIKNCPSTSECFGVVQDHSIEEVVHSAKFQILWNIHKDQIEVCKDCEFRYVCSDCRAYLSETENVYSKPAKCGYNPYEGTWSNGVEF